MIRPATSLSQREAGKTDVHLSGVLQEGSLRKWRNWQTRTFEGRVGQPMRVQVPPSAPTYRAIGSVGERFVHTEEVTGSNPVSPIFPPGQRYEQCVHTRDLAGVCRESYP
jgi:hypothetical protein